MMPDRFAARSFFLLVFGGFCASAVALANTSEPPLAVALFRAGPSLLEWTPLVEFERVTLALADPQGVVRTHEFAPGEAPALSLFDAQGAPLPDGTYTWELRVTPRLSADLQLKIEDPRRRGDEAQLGRLNPLTAPLVQSGHFTLAGGSLLPSGLPERPERRSRKGSSSTPGVVTAPDQVVPDDLIVDGKGCIGLGCSNNEAFGPEALRLKQSVVRLRFEDTSTQTGFPTRDWQLTVNDSASGGADRFSLEDLTAGTTPITVRGGAPSNSLYIDALGRIGIGTAAPTSGFHLFGVATTDVFAGMGVNTATGPAFNYGYSGATFGRSSGFFNIRPDALATPPNPSLRFLTANVERMIITNTGNVGIATTNPETNLHVFGTNTNDTIIGLGPNPDGAPGTESALNFGYGGASFGRGGAFLNVRPDSGAAAPNPSLRFLIKNIERMIIDNEGFIGLGVANPTSPIHHSSGAILTAGGAWQNGSSREIKQDIAELAADEAFSTLQGLAPVKFAYKVDPKERHIGFIAEDVPNLVASPDRKTLSPMDIVAVLTRVAQEQQTTIEKQQKLIGQLEERLARLEGKH